MKPYVHLVFHLTLKKENVPPQAVHKKNALSMMMGRNCELPGMVPCENFILSEHNKINPYKNLLTILTIIYKIYF